MTASQQPLDDARRASQVPSSFLTDRERRRLELPIRIDIQAVKLVKAYAAAWRAGGGSRRTLELWRKDPKSCPAQPCELYDRLARLPTLALVGPVNPEDITDVDVPAARMWGNADTLERRLALRGVVLLPDDERVTIEPASAEDYDAGKVLVCLDLRYEWKDIRFAYEALRGERGITARFSPGRRLVWGSRMGRGWQLAFRLLHANENLTEREKVLRHRNVLLAQKVGMLEKDSPPPSRRRASDVVGELLARGRGEVERVTREVLPFLTPLEYPSASSARSRSD